MPYCTHFVLVPFHLLSCRIWARHTNDAEGKKTLLLQPGKMCATSRAGATFMRTKAFETLSRANVRGPVRRPSIIISGPMTNRIIVSLPEKVHSAIAPYICMLNWMPIETAVNKRNGLARVKRLERASAMETTGSHRPSISIVDLHTGHLSGRLDRSQSVTHDSMQSW